jgi:hypothetical protein
MDSNDAAELIAEIHEERADNEAAEKFRNGAALLIAILAAILAVGGLGGGNATDDMVANNIKASDSWAFYQAKNVRQTLYQIAAEDLDRQLAAGALTPPGRAAAEKRLAEYRQTVARYDSEPDPKAPNDPLKGYEAAFAIASAQDNNFDLAEVALQLALVLGSVAILATNRWILALSAGLGLIGTLLTINGFLLLAPLP